MHIYIYTGICIYIYVYIHVYIVLDLSLTELNGMELYIPYAHQHKLLSVIHVEGFYFQFKVVSFPFFNNYKLSFRTFGNILDFFSMRPLEHESTIVLR